MAREKREKKVRKTPEWIKTLRQAYSVTREARPILPILLLAMFIGVMAIGIGIGIAVDRTLYISLMTIPFALIITLFSFSRIAEGAAYASIAGQAGAGASVLMSIRKGWTTTAGVQVARNQDLVHRSLGRAGVVITGEGSNNVRVMMTDERRKMERFLSGVPVHQTNKGAPDDCWQQSDFQSGINVDNTNSHNYLTRGATK
jgi:F0F1-type ATP synthase assembly protein I